MTKQVQDNKRAVTLITIIGWGIIGLAFTWAVYRGNKNIGNIQKDIAILYAKADSTLTDSVAFMRPTNVKTMVEESTQKVFDTYVSTQGNLLAIVAVLITVIVIAIPFIMNSNIREINEDWFRKKVEDAEKNMNDNLQNGLKKIEDAEKNMNDNLQNGLTDIEKQSKAGVKAIEEEVYKQKNDIENHKTKIDEQAKTVARQAEDIKILKSHIEKITNNYKSEVEFGESLKQVKKKGDIKEQIEYLENMINKNKENYPASGFYELGKLYFEKREYKKSIDCFETAVDRKPDYVEAYQALSDAYLTENIEEAWKKIEQGIRIKETSSLLETRCKVFFKMGLYEDAKRDVIKSIDLALKEENTDREGDLKKLQITIESEIQKHIEDDPDRVFTVGKIDFRMKKVGGGAFLMGATEADPEAFEDEKPAHRVLLYDYYIGETVVTQALWKAVMGNSPSHFIGNEDYLPVEQVSWNDCQEFIRKLNQETGKNFRLPTEAEWEFAARGGNKSQGYTFSGGNSIDDVAWYANNSDKKTHPVKCKKANELGLFDMSGNVWEMCQDWKESYIDSEQINPQGPLSGMEYVLRGGSWFNSEGYCRVSHRHHYNPNNRTKNLGFRLVLS